MVHEVFTHELVGPACQATPLDVMNASRPPSVNKSIALMKKVVVYGLGSLFIDTAFLPQVGIEHLEIAERDIGGYDIEFRVFKALSGYRLEPCRYRVCIVMQEREDKPRDAVLFKA